MKKKMMVLTGLLMAVVITAYSVSGTYAKYTSTFTGTSSATVAKWAFTIGGTAADASSNFTFDLFKTILDTDRTTAEDDVAAGKIAPGTSGSFNIAIANNSEVSANITMNATVTNLSNIPLEYSVDGTTWNSDLNTVLGTVTKDLKLNGGSTDTTQKIEWRWSFNDVAGLKGDDTDTNLGILAATGTAPQVTVELHVVATQID